LSKVAIIPQIKAVLELDKTIHEPARFVILAILLSVESADFTYLMAQTGLTQGNLSAHLSKLEAAGFISVEKRFEGKRPRTTLEITPIGVEKLKGQSKILARFLAMIGVKTTKPPLRRNGTGE